jgi:hypothetical protein
MPDHDDDQRQDYDDRLGRRYAPLSSEKVPTASTRLVRSGVWIGLFIGALIVGGIWLWSVGQGHRDGSDRMRSANNLKQIGVAIHDFDEYVGEMPNNIYSHDGKPLLSWRVFILPFVEEESLFRQFKLDEPWDSPNNLPLLQQMPRVYALRGETNSGRTYYRGFSNPGAVFERRPKDAKVFFRWMSPLDMIGNTFLVVEAGDSVEWTKPDDLDASPDKPIPKLGGLRSRDGKFQALMGDGSIRRFPVDIDEAKLRALVSHSGGEIVNLD